MLVLFVISRNAENKAIIRTPFKKHPYRRTIVATATQVTHK